MRPFRESRAVPGPERNYILYIVLIGLVSLAASVLLHELGHLAVGMTSGCRGEIVLVAALDPLLPTPATELTCPVGSMPGIALPLSMSGFIFLLPFGLGFLAFRKRPERFMSIVVVGFGMVLGGLDLMLALQNSLVPPFTVLLGAGVMAIGVHKLVGSRIDYIRHMRSTQRYASRIRQ